MIFFHPPAIKITRRHRAFAGQPKEHVTGIFEPQTAEPVKVDRRSDRAPAAICQQRMVRLGFSSNRRRPDTCLSDLDELGSGACYEGILAAFNFKARTGCGWLAELACCGPIRCAVAPCCQIRTRLLVFAITLDFSANAPQRLKTALGV